MTSPPRLALVLPLLTACYRQPGALDDVDGTTVGPPGSDGSASAGTTGADESATTTTDAATSGTTATNDASDGTSSAESTTAEAPPACTAEGAVDPACALPNPFCVGGNCVGCDGIPADTCRAQDPSTPVCDAGECRACVEHDECASGACRIATGECFAEDHRLWVDNTADCAAGTGTEALPLCHIDEAFTLVDTQPGAEPWAVFVAGSNVPYPAAIWTNARPVALVGPTSGIAARIVGGQLPLVVGSQNYDVSAAETYVANVSIGPAEDAQLGVYGILVQPGSQLFLHDSLVGPDLVQGLDVYLGSATVVRSTIQRADTMIHVWPDSELVMIDSRVDALNGADVMMTIEGDVSLVRTVVDGVFGLGDGIDLTGSLRLENSVIFDSEFDIWAHDGGRFDLVYATVSRIGCDTGAGASTIRNSIVMQFGCAAATVDHSAVDAGLDQGTGNATITAADWPDVFVAPGGDDYHLQPGPTVVTGIARWRDGDPPTDLEGTPRPAVDGTADNPGAYEP